MYLAKMHIYFHSKITFPERILFEAICKLFYVMTCHRQKTSTNPFYILPSTAEVTNFI